MKPRALRISIWIGAVLAMPLVSACVLAIWAHSEGSLAQALQFAQRWLPDDQQLSASRVRGSLARGGHLASLRWSRPGLTVTIEDMRLDWTLRQLASGELRVRTLAIARIHARSAPQPDKPDEPFVMPAAVSLPIRLTVPLSVARLDIETVDETGSTLAHTLHDLAASYRYDGTWHTAQLANVALRQSRAQARVALNGQTLHLEAQATASLRDPVANLPFSMQATLTAAGSLAAAGAARLDLALDATQTGVADSQAARIAATATVHPWRAQPVQRVDVSLSRVNAHAFLERAPHTSLRGRASLEPLPGVDAWQAQIDIANDSPGTWDRQLLPLDTLTARGRVTPIQIDISRAAATLGTGAQAGTVAIEASLPLNQPEDASLQAELLQVNLRLLDGTLPRTALGGTMSLKPASTGRHFVAGLLNPAAGPLDDDRIPVEQVKADVRQREGSWRVETLDLQWGDGHATVQAQYTPQSGALELVAQLRQIPLRQTHRKLAADAGTRLTGSITASGSLRREISFQANAGTSQSGDLQTDRQGEWQINAIEAKGRWSTTRLFVERLHVDAFRAAVDGGDIDISLPGFESIKARLDGSAPGLAFSANTLMTPRAGSGSLRLQLQSAGQFMTWMRNLPLVGAHIPNIDARGAGTLETRWRGTWRQWKAGFTNPAARPPIHLEAVGHTEGLDFRLPETSTGSARRIHIRALDLDARGDLDAATLALAGRLDVDKAGALLDVRLQSTRTAGRGGAQQWNIGVEKFAAAATLPGEEQPWKLQLSDNLQLSMAVGSGFEIRSTAGDATVTAPLAGATAAPLKISWQPSTWRRTAAGAITLRSAGSISGIQPAWLDTLLARRGEGPLTAAGIRTDLLLAGSWDANLADRVALRASLHRQSGDIALVDSDIRAGIRAAEISVQADDRSIAATLNWDTARAGTITGRIASRLSREAGGWRLPRGAPLDGTVRARLQELSTWGFLAPPGWRVQGELDADVRISGTVQRPQLDGGIQGRRLGIRSVLDGVELHDGALSAALRESRLQITELTFEGGTGSKAYVRGFSGNRTAPPRERGRMQARGYIDWSRVSDPGSGIQMNLDAQLQRMQVLVRHDRQMTLSGDLSARLDAGALQVRGELAVDRASIVLPEASAPRLGDDVLITRRTSLRNAGAVEALQARGELQTRKPMDMEIQLDLGRDLALEGQGITTRLEGELTVRSTPVGNDPLRVFGEVRTVEGRYRAWGQALDVETGVIRFNGSYANPTLELLAIRPKIEVRAGVRVSGTLLAPRVQLFSEPDLPEGEKLSWVVLGRATVITGAEGSSMQQAALGLAAGQLGGRLASGLGLDELGLSEAGVSIGKRISNELYLTYQQGLAGAASTLFIFYDITRKLTLRAAASEASAVDLIYTIKYD